MAVKAAMEGIHSCFKMGAVVIKGGRVLSRGSNLSWGCRYPVDTSNYIRGKHAEARAIRPRIDVKGATIYIARVNKNDKLATMSKPCKDCIQDIAKSGIRKVAYVDWNGDLTIKKTLDLLTEY